ncbi:MAG: hypothetical protein IJT36_04180 [Alphaproteobacteria bacterium]|nr:hypothetical protein [Alphaproteobacteria bacterium]
MKDFSYKEAILMAAIQHGFITTNGIKLLKDHQSYLRKRTSYLTKKGFLADRKITHKNDKKTYSIKYKAITKSGIEYAKKHWSDKYSWLKYLPNPLPDFYIITTKNIESLYRQLLSTTASILFKQVGFDTVFMRGEDNREGVSYKQLIYNAKEQDKIVNGIAKTPSTKDITSNYIHSNDIYSFFHAKEGEQQQLTFTQQIGFLVDRSNSYIIYSAKKNGIRISYTMLDRVRVKFRNYLKENNIPFKTTVLGSGFILADTPMVWKKTALLNINNKNKKKTGLFLQNLYCFPVIRDIVYIVDKILYYGDDFINVVIDILLSLDDNFQRDRGLKYKDIPVIIGLDMDIVKLQSVYKEIQNGKEFVMVCIPWQEEYYKMIFPDNVIYYHMGDYLLEPV